MTAPTARQIKEYNQWFAHEYGVVPSRAEYDRFKAKKEELERELEMVEGRLETITKRIGIYRMGLKAWSAHDTQIRKKMAPTKASAEKRRGRK